MTAYTFLVTTHVERESGMHASRDEIADDLAEKLNNAIEGESISGVGPRSDSEYSVEATDVAVLDKKSERDTMAAHDEMVAAEYPGDVSLRAELRDAIRARAKAEQEVGTLTKRIERMERKAREDSPPTRIYQRDSGRELPPTYLRDGQYDEVSFVSTPGGDRLDDGFSVRLSRYGDGIEIRANSMGKRLVVMPDAANSVTLRMISDR